MDLKSLDLFKAFSEEELEKFAPIIKALNMKAGEILFNENEPGDALYAIFSGALRIYKVIDSDLGTEKSLALLETGQYLGEMTLMDGTPRSASVRAEVDSVVLKISRDDFIDLLHKYPPAAIRLFVSFMKSMAEHLRNTNEELVALYEIGKIVSDAPLLNELLEKILKTLVNTVKADLAAIFIINEISNRLEIQHAIGEGSFDLLNKKIKLSDGIVCHAITKQSPLMVCDFDTDNQYSEFSRLGYERDSMIIAPLIRRDKPFGAVLVARNKDHEPFNNAKMNLVTAVAIQASAAIESAIHQKDRDAKQEYDRKYFQF